MARFAGINGGSIQVLSDAFFVHKSLDVIEIPTNLQKIEQTEFVMNYEFKNGKFINKKDSIKISEIKIAFINNWAMKCGISSYSENIISELIKYVKDYKLFIEHNDNPIHKINEIKNKEIDNDKIVQCWERGESLLNLINEINNYKPDIILIEHEFGIFPNAMYFLSLLTQLSKYKIVVILHSVFPEHLDKMIIEGALTNVVVHLDGAKSNLKNDKQIRANTFVIPHGCDSIENKPKLWNFYKSEHTFLQTGFAFKYKNFQSAIEATFLLKHKYPDIFFTGILSETDFNHIEHQFYYDELFQLVKTLGLQENVALIRGFQSDLVLDAYYRTNKVAVFPYKSHPGHLVYGASGSCRIAFSKQIPVISSSIPHFSDVPTIKADTSEEIANELDKLFSSPSLQKTQVIKQNQYIEENSWANVAQKYIKVFEEI